MRDLDLLVVVDPFLSETAATADVVLPAAQSAEEDGTMTNLEGRILLRRQATEPPEGVWTDLRILKALADRLGTGSHFSASPAEVFSQLRAASSGGAADYAGVSYERVAAEDGIFGPGSDPCGHTEFVRGGFAADDGRASFFPVQHRGTAEIPSGDFPFFLTTGGLMVTTSRVRRRGACRNSPPPNRTHSLRFTASGPRHRGQRRRKGAADDEARADVAEGAPSPDIRIDTLFVPFHWGGDGAANILTNTAVDHRADP